MWRCIDEIIILRPAFACVGVLHLFLAVARFGTGVWFSIRRSDEGCLAPLFQIYVPYSKNRVGIRSA